jgi:hypothetical protein
LKSTKSSNLEKSNQLHDLTSSELTSVAGGNSAVIIGVPFLIGCLIGDALWGDGTMSGKAWMERMID